MGMTGRTFASALALAAAPLAAEPAADCADPVTQSAMNMCSFEEYRAADAQLNAAWKRARDLAKSIDRRSEQARAAEDHFARLLDAQRKWLAYRDAHCLAVAGERTPESGTIWPLVQNNCMEELTLARTKLLRQYADQPN